MSEKSFNKINFSTGQVFRNYFGGDGKFYDDKGVPLPDETLAAVSAGETVTLSVGHELQVCTYTTSLDPNTHRRPLDRLEKHLLGGDDSFSHLR
jgi:hypothetical protein